VSRVRTERLVNLVICLLSTRRFLTSSQIAQTVAGYEHDEEDPKQHDAFQRMFERDKAELRDLGVPVEMGTPSAFDSEAGYRIARRDYALPDIHLEPDEAAAVGLATRFWHVRGLASAAASGLLKLRAAGVEVDPQATLPVEPVVAADPAIDTILTAVRNRRAVTFGYRRPEDDEPTDRHLQPWGAVSWRGRWYVVGYDTDRAATRCFRLSRVEGTLKPYGPSGKFEPPEKVDLVGYVASNETPADQNKASVRVRVGTCAGLRRWAIEVRPGDDENEGWDTVLLPYRDPDALAGRLVGYGADVIAIEPPEVRQAVIDRLTGLAGVSDPVAAKGDH
jgi:proteasome accessory factor B